MKKTKKQLQTEKLEKTERKIWNVMDALEIEDLMSFIIGELKYDIGYYEDEIENEIDYVKNETDSYASQKADSRRLIKVLKKKNQQRKLVLKQVEKAFAAVRKTKDV